jgi:hypothetical protein
MILFAKIIEGIVTLEHLTDLDALVQNIRSSYTKEYINEV